MPSSAPDHISLLCKKLLELKPETILDVGVGYGKLGFLAREYLESWNDRVHPQDWQVKIYGVEAWEPYTTLPWYEHLYNGVYQGTLQSWCDKRSVEIDPEDPEAFDVIVAGDVIEHLEKEEALHCLAFLLKQCKGELLLSLPIGPNWLNNQVVDGNPFEKHRSAWEVAEVEKLVPPGHVTARQRYGTDQRPVFFFALKGQYEKPLPKVPARTVATAPFRRSPERDKILHVHNVRRCGGTGNFVYDFATAFPEFRHVALCVNDPVGDAHWINATSQRMRGMYAPMLTKEIVDEINPGVIVLHCTSGKRIGTGDASADWPYPWLSDGGRRYVISWHHIPTYPLMPADLDVFVSEHVRARYSDFLKRMNRHVTIPPCMDLKLIASKSNLTRTFHRTFTSGGKANDELKSFERFGWTGHHEPPGVLGGMADYLNGFPFAVIWSGEQETWCRTVTEAMAAGCVVAAHRAGAIPEQIKHGVNGYLFNDLSGLKAIFSDWEECMETVQGQAALNDVRKAAQEWALANADLDTLRQKLYPFLLRGVIGGV